MGGWVQERVWEGVRLKGREGKERKGKDRAGQRRKQGEERNSVREGELKFKGKDMGRDNKR